MALQHLFVDVNQLQVAMGFQNKYQVLIDIEKGGQVLWYTWSIFPPKNYEHGCGVK